MNGDSGQTDRLEQHPFDETEFLRHRITSHLDYKILVGQDGAGVIHLLHQVPAMTHAELVALARDLGIDPDVASDADVARYLLSTSAADEVQRITNTPEYQQYLAAFREGQAVPPSPSVVRHSRLHNLFVSIGVMPDGQVLRLFREHGLSLPVRGDEASCAMCGSPVPLGAGGLCTPCRAVMGAWQGRGEGTDQGWAVDSEVIAWEVLAGHVPALVEPKPGRQIDPALEEFLRALIEACAEVVRVVQTVVEGGRPPTTETVERIKRPFVQAFGPSGGPAFAAAAFAHFTNDHPGAWAFDPGRALQEGMRNAARDAAEFFFPEGLLDEWEDWLRRLGVPLESLSTFNPEFGDKGGIRGEEYYCNYCGTQLHGLGEICRSCSAQERPWCRNCGQRRSVHTGTKLECPPEPRGAG